MRRGIVYLIVFVLLLAVPFIYRRLTYYELNQVERPSIPTYKPADVVTAVTTPKSLSFIDDPQTGQGAVLLDVAHNNQFTLDELGYLSGRLSDRGYEMIPFSGGNLAASLRAANAFVVITPLQAFSFAELQAVKDFVDRGGRLFLAGDPTRYEISVEEDLFSFTIIIDDDEIPLNSLANEFDVGFNGDYLYNMTDNEGNFRNIIVSENGFAESELTADLGPIVFYGAHSLDVGPRAEALLAGDDHTWTSDTDRPGGLTLAATSEEGRVLAVSDIHFLMAPYYTVLDNGRFIAHIADFLTETDARGYVLTDFPYFYERPVDLVYTGAPDLGPGAFDQVITLQEAFQQVDKELNLAAAPTSDADTLYLGLYNQSEEVADILASYGITFTIEPPILTEAELAELEAEETEEADAEETSKEGDEKETTAEEPEEMATAEPEPEPIRLIHSNLGTIQMSGTALILLDESESGGQRLVVVLAASKDGLDYSVGLLHGLIPLDSDGALGSCLVQDNLALCPTGIEDEEVEAELLTGGLPEDQAKEDIGDGDQTEEPDIGADLPDLNAIYQGSIAVGDLIEGELAEEESDAWGFVDGPAVIDITLEAGEELDAVLELYDADNNFVTSTDTTFSGEVEEILGAEIESDGRYTIVVRDFFDDGGSYILTVTESGEAPDPDSGGGIEEPGAIENIFLFVDDKGDPIGDGITSADAFISLLGSSYEITTWVSSDDGPLTEETLEGTDLLIWDSGDYQNPDALSDDDVFIILAYADSGGALFMTGSSPPLVTALLGEIELGSVVDLEIAADDPALIEGFTEGEVIVLDEPYDTILSDAIAGEIGDGTAVFFLRGPESEASGQIVGQATVDDFSSNRTVLLLLPFIALPEEVQSTMLDNWMVWFAEGGG
ncbi:MAG: hypothetical protein GY796_34635 [Chloroflexi bacterium]|nr:hypothetical protein [Chloroflexota bacterium]